MCPSPCVCLHTLEKLLLINRSLCLNQDGDCFYTRLLKVDADLGTSQEWKEGATFPGEPIFVPHPEASKEDQGVLLSVVLAGKPVTKRRISTSYKSIQELCNK